MNSYGCRVAAERAAGRYTLICDGPQMLTENGIAFLMKGPLPGPKLIPHVFRELRREAASGGAELPVIESGQLRFR